MMCVTMYLLLHGIWQESGYNLGGLLNCVIEVLMALNSAPQQLKLCRKGWMTKWQGTYDVPPVEASMEDVNGHEILFILSVMKYLQYKITFLCAKISVLSGLPGEHNETMAPTDNTTASWINCRFWSSGYIRLCLCFLVRLNCNN